MSGQRLFYFCEHLNESGEGVQAEERNECSRDEANLVSSLCDDGKHRPVLDFDFPARLVPSTSPDHYHLYIDVPMEWDVYEKLLTAMQEAGVLQKGFAQNAIKRKASFVRPEWVKKTAKPEAKS